MLGEPHSVLNLSELPLSEGIGSVGEKGLAIASLFLLVEVDYSQQFYRKLKEQVFSSTTGDSISFL